LRGRNGEEPTSWRTASPEKPARPGKDLRNRKRNQKKKKLIGLVRPAGRLNRGGVIQTRKGKEKTKGSRNTGDPKKIN